MTDTPANSAKMQRGRPFAPGQSGNPQGRPQGSRSRALLALDQIAEDAAPAMLQSLVQAAMAGDAQAARLVLDRIWPPRKGRAVPIALPATKNREDVEKAMAAVLAAVADGTLSPDEAQPIASLLETARRMLEPERIHLLDALFESARHPRPPDATDD